MRWEFRRQGCPAVFKAGKRLSSLLAGKIFEVRAVRCLRAGMSSHGVAAVRPQARPFTCSAAGLFPCVDSQGRCGSACVPCTAVVEVHAGGTLCVIACAHHNTTSPREIWTNTLLRCITTMLRGKS